MSVRLTITEIVPDDQGDVLHTREVEIDDAGLITLMNAMMEADHAAASIAAAHRQAIIRERFDALEAQRKRK